MYKPSLLYQYLATFTAQLSIVTSGMHYAWPSPSLPQLTSNSTSFQITNDEGSWIVVMQLISPVPACFLGAYLMNIIGRKKTILFTAIPYVISWVMIAFANSALMLAVARFFAGFSDGLAFTAIPLYIGEIADPKIRGFLGVSTSISWIFGMLLINLMGSYLSISLTAGVSALFPLLLVCTFVWMPESPYLLIMRKDLDGARKSLAKFRGRDDEAELLRLQKAVQEQNQTVTKWSIVDVFKNNLRGIGIIAVVRNAQQMSGVSAITFYTLSIFNEAGDFMSPLTATIIYVTVQCVMTVVCSGTVDRVGRRPLLIMSIVGSAVSLFVEGTYFYIKSETEIDTSSFNFVPVAALMGYVVLFNLGAQPMPLVLLGEIFPTNVKAIASCISEVYFCIVAAIVSKFFQVMRDAYGMYLPFYVFSFCCFINLVFVIFFVPETKGKTLEEIQDHLKLKKKLQSMDKV